MLAHVLGDSSHTNRGEVVDAEAGIARVVFGEEANICFLEIGVLEALNKFLHAHDFSKILEQNLDEDTGGRCGFVLVEMDAGENMPAEGVRGEHVSEELGNVTDLVGFVAMNGVIILPEGVLEEVGPHAVDFGEALAYQAIEFGVGALLGTALHDHGTQLGFHTGGKSDLDLLSAVGKDNGEGWTRTFISL